MSAMKNRRVSCQLLLSLSFMLGVAPEEVRSWRTRTGMSTIVPSGLTSQGE